MSCNGGPMKAVTSSVSSGVCPSDRKAASVLAAVGGMFVLAGVELMTTQKLQLIDELTPVAADLGCVDELNLVREIIQRGAGYERQRAIYARTGDWKDVVDATCAEMWELTP